MIREAIRTILLGDAGVSAAVGGKRIYPLQMAQGVREPSLVYQRVGGVSDTLLEGPQGLRETRLQLDAWALDPDAAARLITLAETRLNGYSGVIPVGDDSPQAECKVSGLFLDNERDSYDGTAKLFRDSRDFRVLWCPA